LNWKNKYYLTSKPTKLILLSLLVVVIVGCNDTNSVKTHNPKNKTEDLHQPTPDSLTFTLAQIHDEFNMKEFGFSIHNHDFIQLKPFLNVELVTRCLIAKIPSSSLKEWLCNNKHNIGKDDWFQIKPIGLLLNETTLLYLIATYQKTSAAGERYWDLWCLTSIDGEIISKVTNIGNSEYYPFTESGEEDGAEYFIRTIEGKNLTIELLKPDSIVCKQIKYTLRDGYDWRIDQNFEINDSVAMPEVIQVFNVL
jgi:hypothetical protein